MKTEEYISNMIDEKDADLLATKTPFHLENGWELVTENQNPSCSHAQIEQLIQKRIINLIDMEILKLLASFQYLNHYHIRYALADRLHPNYQKESYLDNLNKLKRAGIVLCYVPVTADTAVSGKPPVPASPLRLYCLSQPAYSYMEPVAQNPHTIQPSDSVRKVEIAAADQFLLHFLHCYKEQVSFFEYLKSVRIGTSLFTIDAIFKYRMAFPCLQAAETISLVILSIRQQDNPFPVYFCVESLLMVYAPFESLYQCETDEDGRVKAMRIKAENT